MARYESPYDPSTAPRNLEHVLYEKKGNIAYVTVNRPKVLNALSTPTWRDLRFCEFKCRRVASMPVTRPTLTPRTFTSPV